MRVKFVSVANLEFREAIDYYNEEQYGLGFEFSIELDAAIEKIKNYPDAWEMISNRARRCLLRRFPYAIYYQHKEDEIIIYAVMHTHRDPKRWKERVKK